MKQLTTFSIIAAAAIVLAGCSGGDGGENAAAVQKMAKEPMVSNNPDIPNIDARNDEFGGGAGKKGGG